MGLAVLWVRAVRVGHCWEGATGRSCRRPEIGYNTFVLAPHALCVRSDAQARMPPGASIRVVGPQSALGLNAREIYSIPRQP
jgi:hypothetical protein